MPKRHFDAPTIIQYRVIRPGRRRNAKGLGRILAKKNNPRLVTGEYQLTSEVPETFEALIPSVNRLLASQGAGTAIIIELRIGES